MCAVPKTKGETMSIIMAPLVFIVYINSLLVPRPLPDFISQPVAWE